MKYAFIVCCARSGSTVLQKALNSSKGVLIRGENAGIVRDLIAISRKARSAKATYYGDYPTSDSPWFGFTEFDPSALQEDIRRVVTERFLRPESHTRVAGFKEIRWNFDNLRADLEEIRSVFPGAKFVFNVRNPSQISRSGPWANNQGALEWLRSADLAIRTAAKEFGQDGLLVEYEDWASQPARVAEVLEFLGQSYNLEEIRQVLSIKLDHTGM